jgi:hypothetical protein
MGDLKMQKNFSVSWQKYHSDIAARQAAFGALSRQDRERAYEVVRGRVGASGVVSIDELLAALEN